jgi:hypothetical protein
MLVCLMVQLVSRPANVDKQKAAANAGVFGGVVCK